MLLVEDTANVRDNVGDLGDDVGVLEDTVVRQNGYVDLAAQDATDISDDVVDGRLDLEVVDKVVGGNDGELSIAAENATDLSDDVVDSGLNLKTVGNVVGRDNGKLDVTSAQDAIDRREDLADGSLNVQVRESVGDDREVDLALQDVINLIGDGSHGWADLDVVGNTSDVSDDVVNCWGDLETASNSVLRGDGSDDVASEDATQVADDLSDLRNNAGITEHTVSRQNRDTNLALGDAAEA